MTPKQKIDVLILENKILDERLKLLRKMIIRNIVVMSKGVFYFNEEFNAKKLLNIIDGKREENEWR